MEGDTGGQQVVQSSSRLHYQYLINAGVYAIASITWVLAPLVSEEGWGNWPGLIFSSLLLLSAFAYAGMIFGTLTQVRIDNTSIHFYKKGISVPWTAVKSISYKWYGLYKVTIDEGTFHFVPQINRFIFLREDEFDELIDSKKRHLRIGL